MACLEMYNNSDPNPSKAGVPVSHFGASMSPRISFSNDFVESSQQLGPDLIRVNKESSSSASPDFEFSVMGGGHFMMSGADELFFKGRLLPFKDTCFPPKKAGTPTTLRDELMAGEDDDGDDDLALRPPKGSGVPRWKGLLGLRKSHIGSKKVEAAKNNTTTSDSPNRSLAPEEGRDEEGSSCRDVDMGM